MFCLFVIGIHGAIQKSKRFLRLVRILELIQSKIDNFGWIVTSELCFLDSTFCSLHLFCCLVLLAVSCISFYRKHSQFFNFSVSFFSLLPKFSFMDSCFIPISFVISVLVPVSEVFRRLILTFIFIVLVMNVRISHFSDSHKLILFSY